MPFSKMITWIDKDGHVQTTPRDDFDRMRAAVEAVEQAIKGGEDVDISKIIQAVNKPGE